MKYMTSSPNKPDLTGKRRSIKRRVKGNKFVTKSGKTIKINRSLNEKSKARRDAKSMRKTERQRGMPKGRLGRILFRLHPKRLAKYWFSRDGLIMSMKLTGVFIVVMFFSLAGLFAYFRKDLPNLRDISGDNIGGSIRYYDRTGEVLLWEDYDAVKRVPVESENISDYFKNATIAVEDRDFYDHNGFNVRGISRAAWNNAVGGGGTQGGSTITQQLVKLTTPGFSTEQTVARKIKELILSVELERSYSKDEILTGYLNAAPYGPIEYGAEVASQAYFEKPAKDLTIGEASLLAAIPKSPLTYSPYGPYFEADELIGRQHFILDVMAEEGYITSDERDIAKEEDIIATVKDRKPSLYTGIVAPHFVLAAKEQLQLDLTEASYKRGGWKVQTTLDLNLQKIAEEEVANGLKQIERQRGDTAAFVAEDVTNGQVVALVGGADFNNNERSGKINYAQQKLPPGSSFKPYDYLSLIEHTENTGAGSVLYDTQGPLEGYPCTNTSRTAASGRCLFNYDFRFPGALTLRYALGGSRNVPAVKAALAVGVDKTIETANSLGLYDGERGIGGYKCYTDEALEAEGPCYGSSAIGDGAYLSLDKHVHAYATISRNGNKIPQTYIIKVEDSEGKTITEWEPSAGKQVVRPDSAYIVSDMLSDPRASYMARKEHDYKGWDFSLKTGTTNDSKDGWLMGFSTKYSAGIWVGHHTRQVEMTGFMENMTQPIWRGFMQRAHDNIEPVTRVRPSGVQELPAYVVTQHVGVSSREPSGSTDLFPSWYKRPGASTANEKTIFDKVSNKRATECTPPLATEERTQSSAAQFSSDPFYNSSTNTEDEDDVHKCEDIKPVVSITAFDNGGGKYTFDVSVKAGTHPIASDKFTGALNVTVNGGTIENGSRSIGATGIYQFDYTATADGNVTVQVTLIDSVLYESQDAVDVTVTVSPVVIVPPTP
jgi:membrane peptidoglycan carboxypeptidase